MDFRAYQVDAQRTANTVSLEDKLRNGVLGLCSEAGECAGLLKKRDYQGHGLDKAEIVHELGDVLWYIAEAAAGLDMTIEDIAAANVEKRWHRYPHGFDAERSRNHPMCDGGAVADGDAVPKPEPSTAAEAVRIMMARGISVTDLFAAAFARAREIARAADGKEGES